MTFKIKYIKPNCKEIMDIGFDETYTNRAVEKHKFKTIKIYQLTPAQANIIKQTAISCGTDCAVHRETITGKIEHTDCILSATENQFRKIIEKLKKQPLQLSKLADQINHTLFGFLQPMPVRNMNFDWSKTYIMGILNVTPDSFSDGGCFNNKSNAVNHAFKLINDGADIIDIGGESTRPYSSPIDVNEEINRVIPVLKAIREFNTEIPISIDTRNSETAIEALKNGADIINDVSAGEWDENIFIAAKEYNSPIILNHSKGTPETMQVNPQYKNCVDEVYDYLESKILKAKEYGISGNKIIADVGIGFGKTTEQNIELIKKIKEFYTLGVPILVGHSRKNFLKDSFILNSNDELDKGTLIVSHELLKQKVNIIRVHDVASHKLLKNISESFI